MKREDREQLRETLSQVAGWVERARAGSAGRAQITRHADEAVRALRRVVALDQDGRPQWRVLLLEREDSRRLASIARQAQLPPISTEEMNVLGGLLTSAAAAVDDARSARGVRRFFSTSKRRQVADGAVAYLFAYRAWALSAGLPALLNRATAEPQPALEVPVTEALNPRVGLAPRIRDLGPRHEMLSAATVAGLGRAVDAIEGALRTEQRLRSEARAAGDAVRTREVRVLLADMPVERLREATRDRLLIGPLVDAGLKTVQAVLDRGAQLQHLPGIGGTTAVRTLGAARTLWQTSYDEMPVRLDIKHRTPEATQLLQRLATWDAVRQVARSTDGLALTAVLSPLVKAMNGRTSHLIVFSADRSHDELGGAVEVVLDLAEKISKTKSGAADGEPWSDFLARPADYFALLSELGLLIEDERKVHGDLPLAIVEAIRRLELDTRHLNASLRGYQSFGARFSLVQRKVILGDEMGLGKTVEALAALAHLRARGEHHFLVICPAAVVTNWIREVQSKTKLPAHRLHGAGRDHALRSWVTNGGVGVTTFESLAWLRPQPVGTGGIGCVVVDEAHYIKNPAAQRSSRAAAMIDKSERSILLTGTPLENRLEEFRNLVAYVRPDLVVDANELTPGRFRKQVAPAYLRRNQEDVLTELPGLVEVDEWLPMSPYDLDAYRSAVGAGNFMAMRQAAFVEGADSEKMRRLLEIVSEARANDRKVIVFSYFRDVLDSVARALRGNAFGPLTGSVPADRRQATVDQFSSISGGAVLLAQIVAGGVGLNIQAASIVVICEPQLKPTIEWQAIARARRMGQLNSVQVHRLLSEEGVDIRITQILARKRELFEDFARTSETAQSAPEAFDLSEAQLAREVVAAERERLFSQSRGTSAEPAR